MDREPLLSSLDLNDYAEWLVNYQYLTRVSSVAYWNKIQTQPDPLATSQRHYFGIAEEPPGLTSYEQMRQCLRLSMRAGCRGILYGSHSPLDAKDRATQYRVKALEALNLETQFLLAWFAFGKAEKRTTGPENADLRGLIFRAERAELVAPISARANNQYVMGQDAAYNWSGVVLTPESYTGDLLTPGALRKIITRRRAGGCEYTLDEGSMNSLIFFTQSDSLNQKMTEYAAAYGKRLAELAINIARKRVDLFEETVYGLRYLETNVGTANIAPKIPNAGPIVDRALKLLDDADKSLRRRDVSQAYLDAERATRELREAEREFWEKATANEVGRPVTPLSTNFYDMPAYLEFYQKLLSGRIKPTGYNLIRDGDMERRGAFSDGTWHTYEEESANLAGKIYVDEESRRSGATGLRVNVAPRVEGTAPVEAECPSIFVETSFPTQAGQMICIQGWIKIPEDLTNSVDGLRVYDD
ncbi:MAG: hypothetical protein II807_09385, partial [Thermoguttaceae bacterium]|nr:hypothetical protein [Thermoguttaceae bacterium]